MRIEHVARHRMGERAIARWPAGCFRAPPAASNALSPLAISNALRLLMLPSFMLAPDIAAPIRATQRQLL